jgi:pyridinium-3,5-biscarboxylic acid mononucleotide sulfurtransferase
VSGGVSVLPTSTSAAPTAESKELALREWLRARGSALIAFSGGVDSAYLGFVANQELGERAVCVTAVSPSLGTDERDEITRFATRFHLRHAFIETAELDRPEYRANPINRCYFCKNELFTRLLPLAARHAAAVVCDGNNLDDARDFRPGMKAGKELGVESPLLLVGMTKADIRERSRAWSLPTADKPASPCLASRIPHGSPVTLEKLSVVERGERALRQLGFCEFRLRHHGDIARVEIARAELPRALDATMAQRMVAALKPLGFHFITLDLEGFRSGALHHSIHTGDGARNSA